jgi:hypothetical protein
LASYFLNTNPDGTLIDRNAFIVQIGRGFSVKNIREYDVIIRIFGDFAISCTNSVSQTRRNTRRRPLHKLFVVPRWQMAVRFRPRRAPVRTL